MKVEVIKIGKYDPSQNGKYSRYEGYCLSTKQVADFPLQEGACDELQKHPAIKNNLFHSTLLRGIQTANCLPKATETKVAPLSELKEVPFKLEDLLSEEEFEKNGSNLVRERFVQAFIDNKLPETRQQINDRIGFLLEILRNCESTEVSVISHSFLMKMLEAITSGIDIFQNPNLLASVIPADKKTYPFGGGFQFVLTK